MMGLIYTIASKRTSLTQLYDSICHELIQMEVRYAGR